MGNSAGKLQEMLCAYIDDAGNTGKNLSDATQPIHYVGALVVPEDQWAGVASDLKAIREDARQCGYKGKVLEFHGTEVFQARKGSGWESVKFMDRLRIYESCLQIMPARNLWILLGCCDKPKLSSRYRAPEHPHAIAMWLCLERIAKYSNSTGTLTMMVADDCSDGVKGISRKVLADYRVRGAPFGMTLDFSNLIDTIHFMNSAESAHIQLCDMALFAIRRYEATQDQKIQPLANVALSRVPDRGTIPY
jgi:hypothetical protein